MYLFANLHSQEVLVSYCCIQLNLGGLTYPPPDEASNLDNGCKSDLEELYDLALSDVESHKGLW